MRNQILRQSAVLFSNGKPTPSTGSRHTMDKTIEMEFVQTIYDKISDEWNETRRFPWKKCSKFLDSCEEGDFIVEIGCGNGRNLRPLGKGMSIFGSDISQPLLKFVSCEAQRCCATDTPYRSNVFDKVMSIACIHHMASPERRLSALQELIRISRPGGSILLYVRSNERQDLIHQGACPVGGMESNDITIDWNRGKGSEGVSLPRYHHLFNEDELLLLCKQLPATIESFEQEKDNWVVIMTKELP